WITRTLAHKSPYQRDKKGNDQQSKCRMAPRPGTPVNPRRAHVLIPAAHGVILLISQQPCQSPNRLTFCALEYRDKRSNPWPVFFTPESLRGWSYFAFRGSKWYARPVTLRNSALI